MYTVRNYVYQPEVGVPEDAIEPRTALEDIQDDWVYPVCGAVKVDLEILEK
ncbi:rubredoxin [Trichormus azollae]|uniref:rubredoxin n=1 Tax=Trichormus azollae TaxID=1164 RepID=UPI00325F8A0E